MSGEEEPEVPGGREGGVGKEAKQDAKSKGRKERAFARIALGGIEIDNGEIMGWTNWTASFCLEANML